MAARLMMTGALMAVAWWSAAIAQPAGGQSPSFEQKVVAILNAGGTADNVQSRLDSIASETALTRDQAIAIDAVRTLVRSKVGTKGPTIAEAEAFAARNPGSPASEILMAEAAVANDQPQRGADTLIALATRGGPLVRLVSPATVSRLADALDNDGDKPRTAALAKALLDAGWSRGSASLRSYLAMVAIRDALAAGRAEEARRLLPEVQSPASLHLILIDNRMAVLRGEILQAAGTRLERSWQEYLSRTRRDWLERGDALSASAYAQALKQANRHDLLVDTFLSRFMRGYNCPTDLVARTVAADLADSLVKVGRWSKAQDVMRRSGGISPPAYAAMLLERGDFGQAGSLFERSLKAAGRPTNKAEEKGLAWLRAASACAAFGNGKGAPPLPDPALLDVSARLFVLLCMDRPGEARAALVAALSDEEERADALRWVQPFTDPAVHSKFRTQMSGRIRALQRDPAVVEAATRYGAILDWPLTASVPGLGLVSAASAPAWQCRDQPDWEIGPPQPQAIRLPDSETGS